MSGATAPGWTIAAVLSPLAWAGVLVGSFQYDDFPNLLNDPAMQGGAALWERLVHGIRPLTRLSHVLDQFLWGQRAGGWLLGNLLLHALTVAGVHALARARGAMPGSAALAAMLFALQPAHGMTVAYVSGRAGGLMTALLVAALLAHEQGVQPGTRARVWQTASLICFALACLAKEVALCYPLLLLLWEAGRADGRPEVRTMARRLMPVLLLATIIALVAMRNARYGELLAWSLQLRSPIDSLAHNAMALPATLSLLLRPWALGVAHAVQDGWLPLLSWIVFGAALWTRRPGLLLALVWPVVALLPSHSFIAKADSISESGLYLCWIGPCLAIASLETRNIGAVKVRLLAKGAAVAVLVLTCAWRAMVWGDPVLLWEEAARRDPASVRVWSNLGMAYMSAGRQDFARTAFRHALRLDPGHSRALRNLQILELVN